MSYTASAMPGNQRLACRTRHIGCTGEWQGLEETGKNSYCGRNRTPEARGKSRLGLVISLCGRSIPFRMQTERSPPPSSFCLFRLSLPPTFVYEFLADDPQNRPKLPGRTPFSIQLD